MRQEPFAQATLPDPDPVVECDAGAGPTLCPLAQALLASADAADALVAVKDVASGRYLHVNARMAAWLGRPADQLVGRTDDDLRLFDEPTCAALRAAEWSAAAADDAQVSDHRIERGGERRHFTVVRKALASKDGSPVRWLCSLWTDTTGVERLRIALDAALQQVEQQQQALETLRRVRGGDAGGSAIAPYRGVQFHDQLRREVDLSLREHREFALVAVMLDPTDKLPADATPRVCDVLARLLGANTRAMDGYCQLAPDSFAVLLSGVGLATAHARMEGLRRQCATQVVMHDGSAFGFTVSMGVASFPHTAHTRQDLIDAAQAALHEACRRGGNRVTLATIRFDATSSGPAAQE